MHEVDLAHELVRVASARATEAGAKRVKTVSLEVGDLAGVEGDALRSAFDVAIGGTLLDGATLALIRIPLTVWCPYCLTTVPVEVNNLVCPTCGQPAGEIRSGKELEIIALEIES